METIIRTKFNLVLLGESGVGTTSMLSVYSGKQFDEITLYIIGIKNLLFTIKNGGINYKIKVFDTDGQERYRPIALNTIEISDGYLLVFSVDDRNSFNTLEGWINSIEERCNIKERVLFLVGNKIDTAESNERRSYCFC